MTNESSGEHDQGSLAERARRFRALHDGPHPLLLPCAWDPGSARVLASLGFEALGTTSGGVNWSAGRPDYVYRTSRWGMLAAYGRIASSVDLPVSADLENGYGTGPDEVAATILASIDEGMVGGSIEDRSSEPEPQLLPVEAAAERIEAARAAADTSGIVFTLTARAESYFAGIDEPFTDALLRANRYVAAGADCIFVPGPADLDTIARLVAEVGAPVSVGIGSGGRDLTLPALADVGVRRVSTGGALPRALYRLLETAGREMREQGTFDFTADLISETAINDLFT
ncbi:MAG: isocitrate lyase/phosphoenolpyruvate mutase family protein [Acidimicrobiia bacterium]|nr:isocitrate lyase/phosphoenolpyruvate mutase family protein [Acidimicrobiia bacterium]